MRRRLTVLISMSAPPLVSITFDFKVNFNIFRGEKEAVRWMDISIGM